MVVVTDLDTREPLRLVDWLLLLLPPVTTLSEEEDSFAVALQSVAPVIDATGKSAPSDAIDASVAIVAVVAVANPPPVAVGVCDDAMTSSLV